MNQMERYLRATYAIDCNNNTIKAKAEGLTRNADTFVLKAQCLFYFTRDEIKYNPYLFTDVYEAFKASNVLESGEGFCVQKAVLLAALARATGIPTRLLFADIRNHIIPEKLAHLHGSDVFPYHGYDEFYIGDRWIKATPAFDMRMYNQNRIIQVEFDGKNDGILHPYNKDGELHIEYVRDHGHYDDLPIDKNNRSQYKTFRVWLSRANEKVPAVKKGFL